MAKDKLPSFQFYPGDWRKDSGVQSLSFHDRGVWFEIILFMHESEERGVLLLNGKPMPEEALARLLGLDKQNLTTTLTTLTTYGVAKVRQSDGAIYCERMVREEHIRKVRAESGKKGGNPALLNQKANQNPTTQVKQNATTGLKQIPTPSSSSSSSSSKQEESSYQGAEVTRQGMGGAEVPPPAPSPPLSFVPKDFLPTDETLAILRRAGCVIPKPPDIAHFVAIFEATQKPLPDWQARFRQYWLEERAKRAAPSKAAGNSRAKTIDEIRDQNARRASDERNARTIDVDPADVRPLLGGNG